MNAQARFERFVGRLTLRGLFLSGYIALVMILFNLEVGFMQLAILGTTHTFFLKAANTDVPGWVWTIYVALVGYCLTAMTVPVITRVMKFVGWTYIQAIRFLQQYEIRKKEPSKK